MLAPAMFRGVQRAAAVARTGVWATAPRAIAARRFTSCRGVCAPSPVAQPCRGTLAASTMPRQAIAAVTGCGRRALSTESVDRALAEAMAEAAARVPHLQAVAHKLRELVQTQKQERDEKTTYSLHSAALGRLLAQIASFPAFVVPMKLVPEGDGPGVYKLYAVAGEEAGDSQVLAYTSRQGYDEHLGAALKEAKADDGVEPMAVTGFALTDMLHKLAARGEATPPALVIDAMDEDNSIMISAQQVAGPLHTVATGLSTFVKLSYLARLPRESPESFGTPQVKQMIEDVLEFNYSALMVVPRPGAAASPAAASGTVLRALLPPKLAAGSDVGEDAEPISAALAFSTVVGSSEFHYFNAQHMSLGVDPEDYTLQGATFSGRAYWGAIAATLSDPKLAEVYPQAVYLDPPVFDVGADGSEGLPYFDMLNSCVDELIGDQQSTLHGLVVNLNAGSGEWLRVARSLGMFDVPEEPAAQE